MKKNWHIGSIILLAALFAMLPIAEAGEKRVYLNDTALYTVSGSLGNQTLPFNKNLTLEMRINHSFTIRTTTDLDVEYRAGNGSGAYLLRFRIDTEATGNGRILQPNCTSTIDSAHT